MTILPPIKLRTTPGSRDTRVEPTGVRGVDLYHLPWIQDPRGDLTVGEFDRGFPFKPKRYFVVFGVSAGTLRGEHAHRACHQFLICARGSCSTMVDDGKKRREVILDNPSVGMHVPPMTWCAQYDYSADGALLVLASEHYDGDDYIRDYDAFLDALRRKR